MASPTVLIVGGPNGAGKTTLAELYAEQKDRPYLAADRIAEEIDPDDPYAVRMAAGRQFLRRLDAFIDDRISFVVESTLAGRGLAQAVDRMNGAGYVTRIAFVFLDSADRCAPRAGAHSRGRPCCAGRRHLSPATRGARRTSGRNAARRWIAGSCFAIPEPRCSGLPKARMTRRLYCTETATTASTVILRVEYAISKFPNCGPSFRA